jgi:hypothetical protein
MSNKSGQLSVVSGQLRTRSVPWSAGVPLMSASALQVSIGSISDLVGIALAIDLN